MSRMRAYTACVLGSCLMRNWSSSGFVLIFVTGGLVERIFCCDHFKWPLGVAIVSSRSFDALPWVSNGQLAKNSALSALSNVACRNCMASFILLMAR